MIHIALEVYHHRALVEYPICASKIKGLSYFLHIGITLSKVHVIPNADCFREEGDHVCGFTNRFPMGNLGFSLIQILYRQTQQVGRRCIRKPGPCRMITEQGNRQPRLENFSRAVAFVK